MMEEKTDDDINIDRYTNQNKLIVLLVYTFILSYFFLFCFCRRQIRWTVDPASKKNGCGQIIPKCTRRTLNGGAKHRIRVKESQGKNLVGNSLRRTRRHILHTRPYMGIDGFFWK